MRRAQPIDDCPAYPAHRDDVAPPSILELASRASAAANDFQSAMDDRASFDHMMRVAGVLARRTTALTTAIADAVAAGDGSLS